jgi:hypothetical protein
MAEIHLNSRLLKTSLIALAPFMYLIDFFSLLRYDEASMAVSERSSRFQFRVAPLSAVFCILT